MTDTEYIYLAGPMRQIHEFNFPAFFTAADELRERGHIVCNPAEYDVAELGFEWEGLTGHENLAELGFDLRATFRHDITWIIDNATRVVVLPGWERSRGARAEVATATSIGIEVHELDAFLRWGTAAQDLTSRNPETGTPDVIERTDLANHDYWAKVATDRCCTAPDCCGPGSWCCEHAGPHDHPEFDTPTDTSDTVMVTSETGGIKGRKLAEVGAVDPLAREELAKVAGFGARKYDRFNYLKGIDWSLSVDALHRHLLAFESGIDRDDESGQLHTAHVAWHALALTSFLLRGVGVDDRHAAPERAA